MRLLTRRYIGGLRLNAGLLAFPLLILLSCAIPLAVRLDPYRMSPDLRAVPELFAPGGHVLGTDDLGRDVLSRLVFGARSSVGVGIVVVAVSASLGSFFGLLAGVFGGWIDTIVMRITDIAMTLPGILLAIVLVAVFGSGLETAMIAAIAVAVPGFIRIVRSVSALEMKKQYVDAARTAGDLQSRILFSEVLPNCVGPILAQATLGFGEAILQVAALGFLGLGAKPPIAEWGAMLADARPFVESNPHLIVLPGFCLMSTVLAFTLLGDALQQRLDPKAGGRR